MKFTKIMVPVKGSAIDEETVRLACATARQHKARVLVIHVIEIRRNLPLEAENAPEIQHGELVLENAENYARDTGVQIETELLQARVAGPVLLDEATERGVDLIIVGIPYRKPLEEFYLGSVARYLLKNAPCQVWLCREASTPAEPGRAKK